MNYKKAAEDILIAVGGKENVTAAAHCATRLRLVLKDEKKIDQETIDQLDVVKGTFSTGGQYQIIIGTGTVNNVYKEFVELTDIDEMSKNDVKRIAAEKNTNFLLNFVKILSDIFVPIIPALVAGGLLMGINNVLTAENLFGAKSIVEMYPAIKDLAGMINTFSSAPFAFLPILIGFSATKRFGGNPFLGAALAMIMVHPDLLNGYGYADALLKGKVEYWNIFGLHLAKVAYQGTVLPVLVSSWILAKLENGFRKIIPASLDILLTPLLAILLTGFLTFAGVGPIMRSAGDLLTNGIFWLYTSTGFIGAAVFGLIYSPIVITGMHQSFIAVETQLIANVAKTGGSFLLPIASMANIAQGAATLAVLFVTKDKKIKGIASASSISALLGITEPAIFGVNLKLKYPFVAGMIGSAVSCAFIGLFNVLSVSMGPAALPGIIAIRPQSTVYFVICAAISFIVSFIASLIAGKTIEKKSQNQNNVEAKNTNGNIGEHVDINERVLAPINGKAMHLKEVPDPTFAKELLGKGMAVNPSDGVLVSPVDGTIELVFETKHAVGIKTDSGVELLIHIGIDTVKMQGEGFKSFVKEGERVTAGQKIIGFDLDLVKEKAASPITMILVTNVDEIKSIESLNTDNVKQGDELFLVNM